MTLRVRPGVESLRRGHCFRVLEHCFRLGKDRPTEPWLLAEGEPPVVPPGTWLLEKGWQHVGGRLAPDDVPAGGT